MTTKLSQIDNLKARVLANVNRVGGLEAGLLKEIAEAIGQIRDTVVRKISKRIQPADLTAASTSQTIPFDDAIPAGSLVVGASVDLATEFAGGSVASAVADIGDADVDRFIDGQDIFTGAGAPLTEAQGSPGVGLDGTNAGHAVVPAAVTPGVTVITTTDDVDAITAGDMTAHIYFVEPAA